MSEKEQIRSFIYENFFFNDFSKELDDKQSFLEGGIIDSTGVLELVTFVEETFKINIDDHELIPENLDTVDQLVSFIQSKKAN